MRFYRRLLVERKRLDFLCFLLVFLSFLRRPPKPILPKLEVVSVFFLHLFSFKTPILDEKNKKGNCEFHALPHLSSC